METKDLWLIGGNIAAVLIASGAFFVSLASYRLSAARDRREREQEEPSVELVMPACTGSGPWAVTGAVRNRGKEDIVFVGVILPVHLDERPDAKRNPIRFAAVEGIDDFFDTSRRGEWGGYRMLRFDRIIQIGDRTEFSFDVFPEPCRPLSGPTPVRFYVHAVVKERPDTVYRLPINRTVRTDKISAAP